MPAKEAQAEARPTLAKVEEIVSRLRDKPGALLPILHDVQDALGCIPASAVPQIADALNLSRAEVHGVVSYYHHFRSEPPARHVIQICRAESCQAMGAEALLAWEKVAKEGVMPRFTMDGRWRFVFQGWDGRVVAGEGTTPLDAVLDAMSKEGKG